MALVYLCEKTLYSVMRADLQICEFFSSEVPLYTMMTFFSYDIIAWRPLCIKWPS